LNSLIFVGRPYSSLPKNGNAIRLRDESPKPLDTPKSDDLQAIISTFLPQFSIRV